MLKYIRRRIVCEVAQFDGTAASIAPFIESGDAVQNVPADVSAHDVFSDGPYYIRHSRALVYVGLRIGDWVVREPNGEVYRQVADYFETHWEPADG